MPSLKGKSVTLQHAAEMELLQRDVDLSVIALVLNQEADGFFLALTAYRNGTDPRTPRPLTGVLRQT